MNDTGLAPGDYVKVKGHRGYYGRVLIIDLSKRTVWLDMYPGALGYYRWVEAQFPHSWAPDRTELHAVNVIPIKKVRKLDSAKVERLISSRAKAGGPPND